MLRFDAAINPYGCSPNVVEAMVDFARGKSYRFYGEAFAESLRAQLSVFHGLPSEHFLVYNGAGEALVWQFIANLLLTRERLLTPYPSYERFVEVGKRCAAEVIEVPLSASDWSLPVDRLLEEGRRKRARVALISNPNNPTGNLLLNEMNLATLLDGLPDCLWIVDEAYADYPGVTFAPWTAERPNLVVLRTFSKAYGLAGLRVGYCVAHPTVARRFAALQIPWGVDSMSLVAAQAALEDQTYLKRVVTQIARDCAEFGSLLREIPEFEVFPSDANFFVICLRNGNAAFLAADLNERGIRIRTRPDMPDNCRITCMIPDENRLLVEAINEVPTTQFHRPTG